MSRHSWRGIFIIILVLSLPCYVVGFWLLASSSGNVEPTLAPSPDLSFLTNLPAATAQATVENSPTSLPLVTLDQPITGITQIFPTAITINTATSIPVVIPSNTAVPSATNTAVATEPIILPPTNTPQGGG